MGKPAVSSNAQIESGDLERRRQLLIEPGLLAERNPVFVGRCALCGWPCSRARTVCRGHADLVGR